MVTTYLFDQMNQASHSDFARMGLAHYQPYQSAFDAVPPRGTVCKPSTAPRKRGPKMSKAQQTAIALETANERKARHARQGKARALDTQGRARVDLAPRTTGAITIGSRNVL